MVRVSLTGSIMARLALGYVLLVALAMAAVAFVFYAGTVGVLERSMDGKIVGIADRMALAFGRGGLPALRREVATQLTDRIDTDTEILAVVDERGQELIGNVGRWRAPLPPLDRLQQWEVTRENGPVLARLLARRLDAHRLLIVGRDLSELAAIRQVVARALAVCALVALVVALGGAQLFRRQIEERIGRIRRTARAIESGQLTRRIPVLGKDEFGLLSADINQMLDQIERLMEGVRHVSNAIAHDLRTPLSRVRNRLETALQEEGPSASLENDTRLAIEELDGLIAVFEKLLQIASAESGVRLATQDVVDLGAIAADIVDLYEASAEEQGASLALCLSGETRAAGDRELLANALASLVDNAIKYGGAGSRIRVEAGRSHGQPFLAVRDDGPGVPDDALDKLTRRFYRLDHSRHLPGNGLGLSIVDAIARLHGGRLTLANCHPGLLARIDMPLPYDEKITKP